MSRLLALPEFRWFAPFLQTRDTHPWRSRKASCLSKVFKKGANHRNSGRARLFLWFQTRPKVFLFFYCLVIYSSFTHANSLYPLDSPKKEAQFNYLLKELRCLVCQNQDLADSNADLAKDLRLQVYQLVKNGKSDTEINDYLTSRYGDFILFKPPVKTVTLLLWFGPFLFLVVGCVIFWRTCFKRKRVSYE